jgi:hypothetical protein
MAGAGAVGPGVPSHIMNRLDPIDRPMSPALDVIRFAAAALALLRHAAFVSSAAF